MLSYIYSYSDMSVDMNDLEGIIKSVIYLSETI